MSESTTIIIELVSALPEVYQPVFGHPELSHPASRPCLDRLVYIRKVYSLLSLRLGRPLRVLDLGCAQGFFSLHLAKDGAEVVGIDDREANIRLCAALRDETANNTACFRVTKIEDYIQEIQPGQFDLFLGLSVFHHLCHAHGFSETQSIVSCLAERISVGVFELALAEEPLYWAPSLPKDERSLLSPYSFIWELGRIPTHLSAATRPIIVASSAYWLLEESCGRIEAAATESHAFAQGAHQMTRRYFRGEGLLVKTLSLKGSRASLNRAELINEARFLESPPPGFTPVPRIHGWHANNDQGWLIRDELPGQLLSIIQEGGKTYDAERIIGDLLVQLAALERAGLFHNDIRVWNTLVLDGGDATLIDYGAIAKIPEDCLSHEHPVISFLVFLEEVALGATRPNPLLRLPYSNPTDLPRHLGHLARRIWDHPMDQWSFHLYLQLFQEREEGRTPWAQDGAPLPRVANLQRYITLYEARLTEADTALTARERDASARLGQVEQLTALLHQSQSDASKRQDQVAELTRLLGDRDKFNAAAQAQIRELTTLAKSRETESTARAKQIEQLSALLLQSQSDASKRQEQVAELTRLLVTSQADGAKRFEQIQQLTEWVTSLSSDNTEQRRQVSELSKWLNEKEITLKKLSEAHLTAECTINTLEGRLRAGEEEHEREQRRLSTTLQASKANSANLEQTLRRLGECRWVRWGRHLGLIPDIRTTPSTNFATQKMKKEHISGSAVDDSPPQKPEAK